MGRDNRARSRRSARIASSTLLAVTALLWLAVPANAAPTLSMTTPTAGARTNGTPAFAGETTDSLDAVSVLIYEGTSATGTPRTLKANPVGSSWSTEIPAAEPLTSGKYTVVAEQQELLGLLETATTEPVTFTVDTSPPKVTITKGPKPRSSETTPGFSGTASEATEVTVHVLEGEAEVAHESTTASEGKWSTSTLNKPLPSGAHTFTAYATEVSGIGNEAGRSTPPIEFEVDTEPPSVTIVGPESPSNETTPSFSGKASEDTQVTVHVFKGQTEVAHETTMASSGKWSTSALSSPLESGKHAFTAYATEVSGIGNEPGKSSTASFEVDTLAPTVTIVGPSTPSKNRSPTFTGEASEEGEVIVHILEGGKQISTAGGQVHAGAWSATPPAPLPSGRHTFTAYATEKSGLGNAEGRSAEEVSFEINTEPPSVTIVGPPSRSNKTMPGFSGTASEDTEVTVHVFEGASEVAHESTTASTGSWSTSTLNQALPSGKHSFTAYATEVSGLENQLGKSETVSFVVDTEAPHVTIAQPTTPSKITNPSFSGEASENTPVTVHVFEGQNEVATASTTASGGKWSTAGLSPTLPAGKHTFTAYATEASGLGNTEGKSNTVEFEVNTNPPEVTIVTGPAPRSNQQTPTFAGTASENTPVEVHVFEGLTEVAKAKTTASGGTWEVVSSTLPPGNHRFRAYATETSGLKNEEGTSNEVEFEVDTLPPAVTLAQPTTPSKNTTPSFSGEASEDTEVTVHVFEGASLVASATTTASGGKWTTPPLVKALPSGKHAFTAKAIEKSGISNADGESKVVSFEVNTEAPHVTIEQPTTPSNNTTPTFSGEASEDSKVVVRVFEGTTEVASSATTASGGRWTTPALSTPLPSGKRTFTAQATEASLLSNPEGKSGIVTFEVDTLPPTVTLAQPTTPSNNTSPTFSGTASENTAVEVHVFEGPAEVAHASTTAAGGKWAVGLSSPLQKGKHVYKAFATEKSAFAGNPEGKSETREFEVNTNPPEVTIVRPKTPSNNTNPSFEGTASEETEVTVHVLEGATEVASASAKASGGKWSTSGLNKSLPTGKRQFKAFATEKSGLPPNPEGNSETVEFEVNTNPPEVTIVRPKTPSNNTNPSFEGTASEETEVTVHVLEGSTELATASAKASGGKWSTSGLNKPLPEGKHDFKVFATEQSSFAGNPDGKSETREFEVNTNPPEVTIRQPTTPSNNLSPAFEGTASEETEVTVRILAGQNEVANATVKASAGRWSATLSKPLPAGKNTFTAQAFEQSGLGNADGKSQIVSFEVNTEAPEVTLNSPKLLSKENTPEFSGTSSEPNKVTVKIYSGETTEPKLEVATLIATPSSGKWKTSKLFPSLEDGKYTVQASEQSSFKGNPEGKSRAITFEVNTKAPTVTVDEVPARSNVTTRTFSGTLSSTGTAPVTVEVREGATPEGRVAYEGEASLTGGHWKSELVSLPVGSGEATFTVIARAPSGIDGDPEGISEPRTFVVNTKAPALTMEALKALSNETMPSFNGTTNEATPVTVTIYNGSTVSGAAVTSISATPSGGRWATRLGSPLGDGEYTAVAREPSGIGNGPAESKTTTFSIRTTPPEVTLNTFPTPSSDRVPAFSGTASESEPVTVKISRDGTPVTEVTAAVAEGEWFSAPAERVEFGEYTAIATERSSLGNAEGESAPFTFVVAQIPPTVITAEAADITRTSAELIGSVNPLGGPITACNIEVGPTTAYGRAPECALVSEAPTFPPDAVGLIPVFIRIYGLSPDTVYHYRVVATGEGGTGAGADMTFKTLPPLVNPEAHKTEAPPSSGVLAYAAYFSPQLKPKGKGARIGALLRSGVFRLQFKAPQAGKAVVKWYDVPHGAKLSSKAARKPVPVLVASGGTSFKAAGTTVITLRLTAAGRRLLRHARHIRLTATCAFTPVGQTAVVALQPFSLSR